MLIKKVTWLNQELIRKKFKEPPHFSGKYAKPPILSEIVKNHRF
jgi:hypothetical protein